MANSGTLTVDGSGEAVQVMSKALLFLGGGFGGGTVSIEVQNAAGTWIAMAETYAAADVDTIDLGSPAQLRVTISGSTTPTLAWEIRGGHTS